MEALHPIVAEAVDLALSHMDGSAAGIDVRQSVSRTLEIEPNRPRAGELRLDSDPVDRAADDDWQLSAPRVA